MDYFNTNIIARHDDTTMLNAWMADHFNFMMSMPWLTESEIEMYHEEKAMYLCYDV